MWDAKKGPGCEIDPSVVQIRKESQEQRLELCRALWAKLHSEENPTPAWFGDWVGRVPNFGCGCRSWLREWLQKNPPDYDGFSGWAVGLHNAVNRKLGKPDYPQNTLPRIAVSR